MRNDYSSIMMRNEFLKYVDGYIETAEAKALGITSRTAFFTALGTAFLARESKDFAKIASKFYVRKEDLR